MQPKALKNYRYEPQFNLCRRVCSLKAKQKKSANTEHLLVGLLIFFAQAQIANAQADLSIETAPIFTPRLGIRYTSEEASFEDFFTFESFFPLQQTLGSNLTFLEGQLLLSTSNSALGGNVTLGHRFFDQSANRIWGGYLSYDYRNTGRAVFNQLGVGIESLGEDWDFRANAYLPLGNTRSQISQTYPGTVFFEQNTLQLDRVSQFQSALAGFDMEVGTRLASLGDGSLRTYLGLYYYNGEGTSGYLGIRNRLVGELSNNLRLGLTVQNDSHFGTNVVFDLGINFGGIQRRNPRDNQHPLLVRLGEPVERQASILVDNQTVRDSEPAIDPSTHQPFQFQHVNLELSTVSDLSENPLEGVTTNKGTFENPFSTVPGALAASQPNELVYVQSSTNAKIPSFVLPERVSMLSTGPVQLLDTNQLGSVQLPLSGTGILPRVTGAITLGGNQTLSGFAIKTNGRAAIRGTQISNVTIRDNTINSLYEGIYLINAINPVIANNNVDGSIYLQNASGTATVVDNTVRHTATSNPLKSYIHVRNARGELNIAIAGNTVEGNPSLRDSDGINIDVCAEQIQCTSPTRLTVQILNNTVTNLGNPALTPRGKADGIDFNLGNYAQVDTIISGNTIQNIEDRAITIRNVEEGKAVQLTGTISSNRLNNFRRNGIFLSFVGSSTVTMSASGNHVSNHNYPESIGITALTSGSSQLQLLLKSNTVDQESNTVDQADINAIYIHASDRSKIDTSVQLNSLTSDNLKVVSSENANLCLQLDSHISNASMNLTQRDFSTFQRESHVLEINTQTVNLKGTLTEVPQRTCGWQ